MPAPVRCWHCFWMLLDFLEPGFCIRMGRPFQGDDNLTRTGEQSICKLRDVLKTFLRILCQCAQDCLFEAQRNSGVERSRRDGLSLNLFERDFGRCPSMKWAFTREHLVNYDGERINV